MVAVGTYTGPHPLLFSSALLTVYLVYRLARSGRLRRRRRPPAGDDDDSLKGDGR
jgi:hypothetical protein